MGGMPKRKRRCKKVKMLPLSKEEKEYYYGSGVYANSDDDGNENEANKAKESGPSHDERKADQNKNECTCAVQPRTDDAEGSVAAAGGDAVMSNSEFDLNEQHCTCLLEPPTLSIPQSDKN